MSDLTFTPFYEGSRRWSFGLIGKVVVAAGLGLLFLVPHARAKVSELRITCWCFGKSHIISEP
jgi:hypothetical protein